MRVGELQFDPVQNVPSWTVKSREENKGKYDLSENVTIVDLLQTIETYFSRIPYVHFKDWDGGEKWAMLGEGVVDHKGGLAKLDELGYDGWVISENESRNEALSPKEQQAADRKWLREQGY